jgi:hypothetical protein
MLAPPQEQEKEKKRKGKKRKERACDWLTEEGDGVAGAGGDEHDGRRRFVGGRFVHLPTCLPWPPIRALALN